MAHPVALRAFEAVLVKLRLPTCPLSICHSSGSCSGQATLPIGSSLQYHTPSFLLQSPDMVSDFCLVLAAFQLWLSSNYQVAAGSC